MSVCRDGVSDPVATIGSAISAFVTFTVETAMATAAVSFFASFVSAGFPQLAS